MVLLTSSQVSVAISSFVVFLFTSALFLSGYVVQQKTVRDIREAVKPKPRPTDIFFLPNQFREPEPVPDPTDQLNQESGPGSALVDGADVVEVKTSEPETSEADAEDVVIEEQESPRARKPSKNRLPGEDLETSEEQPSGNQEVVGFEQKAPQPADSIRQQARLQQAAPTPEVVSWEQMSRAERRKKIKQDLMEGSEEGTMGGYRRRMW